MCYYVMRWYKCTRGEVWAQVYYRAVGRFGVAVRKGFGVRAALGSRVALVIRTALGDVVYSI